MAGVEVQIDHHCAGNSAHKSQCQSSLTSLIMSSQILLLSLRCTARTALVINFRGYPKLLNSVNNSMHEVFRPARVFDEVFALYNIVHTTDCLMVREVGESK